MRNPAKSFMDLFVWKKAHELVLSIYKATRKFPKEELYGLTSQIRRSSVSVPANIAEGFKKKSKAEKNHFLTIAHCSLEEVRYYLILIRDLKYCEASGMAVLADEVGKLLTLYRQKIKDS